MTRLYHLIFTLLLFGSTVFAQPTISSFAPGSVVVGNSVTITGTGFNTTPTNNIVYFNGARGTVTAASSTSLTVTVPTSAQWGRISVTTGSRTAYSTASFNPKFQCAGTIDSSSFQTPVTYPIGASGTSSQGMVAGDVDGDGKLDLVAASYGTATTGTISVMRNIATVGTLNASSFATPYTTLSRSSIFQLALGDLNADGKLDLVAGQFAADTVWVYENTSTPGNISFAAPQALLTTTGTSSCAIEVVDIDADGKSDILVSGRNRRWFIFKNANTGGIIDDADFTKNEFFISSSATTNDIKVADMNLDGKPDVVVPEVANAILHVYINNGSMSFTDNPITTAFNAMWGVSLADIDGDGKPDISGHFRSNNTFYSYRNTSSGGTFSVASPVTFATATSQIIYVATADLNGDGKPDLIGANLTPGGGNPYMIPNNSTPGTISFGTKLTLTTSVGAINALASDFDGDAQPDIFLCTNNTSITGIRNRTGVNISLASSSPVACLGATSTNVSYTVAGGTPTTYSLTWDAAALTAGFTNISSASLPASPIAVSIPVGVAAGTYTATITVSDGTCTSQPTTMNLSISAPSAFNVTGGGSYCSGGSGVAVGLSGSQLGKRYQLFVGASTSGSPVNGTGSSITFGNKTTGGTYTVVATDTTTLCTATMIGSATVTVNPLPTITLGTSPTVTQGTTTANLPYTATTNSPTTYTITWSATALGAGFTNISTPAALPSSPIAITVPAAAPVNTYVAAIRVQNATCNSTSVIFTVTVGASNTAPSFTNGSPQTLAVCRDASAVSINNLLKVDESNSGQTMTWSVTSAASHGTVSASYSTTSTGSTLTPTGLTYTPASGYSGTDAFTVQVSDGTATASTTINVTVATPVSGNTVVTNVACNGGATGAINLTASGGTGPYTYNWGSGITTEDRTGLIAGSYSVTITDVNSCTGTANATVTQRTAVSGTTVVTNVACNGGATGAINLTPAGGTAPYTFNWSGGITTEDRAGLIAGSYSVTITDANSCTGTANATVTQPAAVNSTTVVTNVACNGGNTGAINLTTSGGTGPYTYNWGGGITTEDRTGLVAGSYSVTITDANSCTGTASSTVTQPAVVSGTTVVTDVACNGGATGAINLTAAGGTAPYTYNWGSGITTEDRANLVAGSYNVTITDANSCNGNASATVTEPPAPTVNTVSNQALCDGASTTTITFSGAVSGTTYDWTNNTASIGLAASGSGDIASFMAANSGTTPVTATITVTPTKSGCTGSAKTFTITVNPKPTVNAVSDQVLCHMATTTAVNFSGAVSGTTYNWTNSNNFISLAPMGTGNIAAFTATNTSTVPVTATITVTPSKSGCTGSAKTFTFTVNPQPTTNVSSIPDQTLCNGAATTAVTFTGGVSGATYNWTNDNTTIGLAGSGSGDIASFTATNSSAAAVTATITVTPTKSGCTGTAKTFAITVNPTPSVNTVAGQALCNGANTTAISFGGSAVTGTIYNWTNNTTSIGLAASRTGDISSFAAVNTGNSPVVATITVTPIANSCNGTAKTFTITVNPTPTVNTVSNQTLCNGATTTSVNFTGAVSGTTYSWTNNTTSIGLAANGTGNISAFTATNTGSASVTATITVTPSANSCTGSSKTFDITVNPTPVVNTVSNQTMCNGTATTTVIFSGAVNGTTYSWTNNTTSIGLAAGGTGDIGAFNTTNTGSAPVTATITVTPLANGCTGANKTFTITVNPTPNVNTVSNQTLCNGANTTAVNFSGAVTGTTYSWTNNTPSIGLAANGTGNISSFAAANTGTVPVTATITVTPSANGCTRTSGTFMVTVNPTPVVNTISNQALCNGANTAAVNFSGAVSGTTYSWTNNTTSIGLAASGTGNIPSFAAVNTTNAPVTATITIVPSANGCTGSLKTFTITVNPTPTVNTVSNQTLCNGSNTTAVNFGSPVSGTTYSWTNNTTSIGLAASGTGNIPVFTATNVTIAPVTTTIIVTPSANGCTGPSNSFAIAVNPTPTIGAVPNQLLCNGFNTTTVNFIGSVAGTAYSWSNNTPSIGLAASGTGNIPAFTALNMGVTTVTATITVTPSANGCTGASTSFNITVDPTPAVNPVTSQAVCNGSNTTAVNFSSAVAGTGYLWTNSNTTIGLGPNGAGNIASFTGINTGTAPEVAMITVTPVANGCVGPNGNFTITVNPTPMLTSTLAPAAICNNTQFSYTPTSATTGTSFAWSRAAVSGISNPAASGSNNPLETLNNTTIAPVTVTYTYTLTASSCSHSEDVKVVVNPTPKLTSTLTHIRCSGDEFAYTPTSATAGTAYTWTRASVPNITPGSANGTGNIKENLVNISNAPITVTYVYTLTANGCSNNEQVTLLVNPRPAGAVVSVQSPNEVCSNTMFQNFGAAVPPAPGSTYTWTATNAVIWSQSADGQNALVNFPDAGTAVVTLTTTLDATSCDSKTDIIVQVGNDESPQPEVIYHNGRFVCLLNDADSYRWGYDEKSTLDSSMVVNETNQDYLNFNPDFNNRYYWVIVTKDDCMQKAYYNKPTNVASPELNTYTLKLYPNPANEVVNIELETALRTEVDFVITDMAGKVLRTVKAPGQRAQVDVSSFAQGMYSVSCIRDGVKITTVKFVKQ